MKELNNKIEISVEKQPESGDIIVVSFDMEKIDLNEAKDVYEMYVEAFPNNTVIALPKNITFKYERKEDIRKLFENIIKIYKIMYPENWKTLTHFEAETPIIVTG